MQSLPGTSSGPIGGAGDTDHIGTIEMGLLTLVRNLETIGRKSALYHQVDRAGYLALRTLDRIGPVPTNALAEALHLDASTITRQVTALVAGELVERVPNPGDRRSSDLAITDLGLEVMGSVERERRRVLRDMFGGWTESERRQLGVSLTKLNLSLSERVDTLSNQPDPGS